MFVVKYKSLWYVLSAALIAASLVGIFKFGFKPSIDFTGGELTQVKYAQNAPTLTQLNDSIAALNLGGFSVRPSGTNEFIVRTKELTQQDQERLMGALSVEQNGGHVSLNVPTVEQQASIGPVAGAELKSKAVKAIAVVVVMIVLFVTFAFRRVSRPVSSWKYGFATIIALAHDVIIPTGLFVWLGHYLGYEIDLLFITGLLAVLGYSVHDTIVVFDRVRENLGLNQSQNTKEDFATIVGNSVKQTFGRSINTSLTIFIVLLALYIYGAAATKEFALLLIAGLITGTYSSIFIASPLLVTFYNWQKNK